eukprot:TRINITY_DN21808_c0_g2_i1.p1 TRINITY_DN21808_c0_g2~~TRINITY_DN21808_c0_g2_i1.p1  ORF type:complete len:365 (+),score=59.42 TRINITY_DN21808_c0_g2_i1:195-1289(+)
MVRCFPPAAPGHTLPNGQVWGDYNPESVTFSGPSVETLLAECSVELVASGFRWTEGPKWIPSRSTLVFSDTIDAKIYRWRQSSHVELLVTDSGGYDGSNCPDFDSRFEPGSNAIALHHDDLYICQHPTHRIARVKVDEILHAGGRPFSELQFETVVDSYEGQPLISPNDLVVPKDGSVWFTDPPYGHLQKDPENEFQPVLPPEEEIPEGCHNPSDLPYLDEVGVLSVYRWQYGKIERFTSLLPRPNGLAFSPDGNTLWVADSSATQPSWTAFDMSGQVLKRLTPEELGDMPGAGLSDGFKIDSAGRIWSSFPGGVVVIDPVFGRVLAKIMLNTNTSNIEFGYQGDVWITGLGHLWRIKRRNWLL